MRLHTLLVILTISVILLCTISEAKRRPPRRKRPRQSGLSFFNRVKQPSRSPEPGGKESKSVFYYSVPTTTTKPRIILGDSLNFSDLGIESPRPRKTQSHSPSSLSTLEQSYTYDDHENDIPIPHPPPPPRHYSPRRPHRPRGKQNKRHRGPGYRLNDRPWEEHYVLDQPHKLKSPHTSPVPIMPYIRNAGKSLAGAYRAAIINSAKVAKFTGHTASRYFKGIRNLMSTSKEDDRARGDYHENRNDDTTPQDSRTNSITEDNEGPRPSQGPEIIEIDLTNPEGQDPNTLPKVYLDWGGSFWRFFYNKSSDMPHPERNP